MTTEQRNAALTRKRWIVLLASCIANLCIGSLYAWSVFSGPMAEHLNALHKTALTAADLAIVFSIANGDAFITMIAGGALDRKIGSRMVIFIGVMVFGLGFIVSGLATNVAVLVLGFSILCGLANGFAYVCIISNTVKFFPDKKGLAGGLITASFGISSVIIPPIADVLNRSVGVTRAFIIFGVVILSLGVFCNFLIQNCPDDFEPVGWKKKEGGEEQSLAEDKNAGQMLRTPVFYVMLGMLFIASTLGLMTISEASSAAQSMIGMSTSSAALIVSVLALFNTAGRIVCGWISDKIGRINTLCGAFIIAIVALALIYLSEAGKSTVMFAVGICIIGFFYGAFMGVYPGFTSDQFGVKYSSLNYGIMFIGFSSGGLVGPMIMQAVFNGTGSYRSAFLIGIVFSAVGLTLTFLYRIMVRKNTEEKIISSGELRSECSN